jgi:hypothetical protein
MQAGYYVKEFFWKAGGTAGLLKRYTAREILRNEAYFSRYVAMTKDQRNAAGGCFSAAEQKNLPRSG